MKPTRVKLGAIGEEKAQEIKEWCKSKFGATVALWKDGLNPHARWTYGIGRESKEVYYYFFDEKEATLFALQWSGTKTEKDD